MRKRTSKPEPQGCAGCVYFKDFSEDDRQARTKAQMGECRRYPPHMGTDEDGDSFYYWPGTGGDEWCGEFKQRCNA